MNLDKAGKINRWISNVGEIHSDCISNEGTVEKIRNCTLKTFPPNTWQPSSASAIKNGKKDGGSEKLCCSEEDVMKYFKNKRRNAQLANLQAITIDDEWISQQKNQNKLFDQSNVESKSKKSNAAVALAYTSLNKKEKNICQERQMPNVLPITSAWGSNEGNTTQQVGIYD